MGWRRCLRDEVLFSQAENGTRVVQYLTRRSSTAAVCGYADYQMG
jgi:hypothetical protein